MMTSLDDYLDKLLLYMRKNTMKVVGSNHLQVVSVHLKQNVEKYFAWDRVTIFLATANLHIYFQSGSDTCHGMVVMNRGQS